MICPKHPTNLEIHLKTEPCISCLSKERLKEKSENAERIRENEERAQGRISNKGKKK